MSLNSNSDNASDVSNTNDESEELVVWAAESLSLQEFMQSANVQMKQMVPYNPDIGCLNDALLELVTENYLEESLSR